jgi:hypothetical protein
MTAHGACDVEFNTLAIAMQMYALRIPPQFQHMCGVLMVPREFDASNKRELAESFDVSPMDVILQGAKWLLVVMYDEVRPRSVKPNQHSHATFEQKGKCCIKGYMHSHHFVSHHYARTQPTQVHVSVRFDSLFARIQHVQIHSDYRAKEFALLGSMGSIDSNVIHADAAFEGARKALQHVLEHQQLASVDTAIVTRLQTSELVDQDRLALHYMVWALAAPELALNTSDQSAVHEMKQRFLQTMQKMYYCRTVLTDYDVERDFPMCFGCTNIVYLSRRFLALENRTYVDSEGHHAVLPELLRRRLKGDAHVARQLYDYVHHWVNHPKLKGFLVMSLDTAQQHRVLDWSACLVVGGMVVAPEHYAMRIGAYALHTTLQSLLSNHPESISSEFPKNLAQRTLLYEAQKTLTLLFDPALQQAQQLGRSANAAEAFQQGVRECSFQEFRDTCPPCVTLLLRRVSDQRPARRLKHAERLRLGSLCAAAGVRLCDLQQFVQAHVPALYPSLRGSMLAMELKSVLGDFLFAYRKSSSEQLLAKAPACDTMKKRGSCAVMCTQHETHTERCCAELNSRLQNLNADTVFRLFNPTWYSKSLLSAVRENARRLRAGTIEFEPDSEMENII